MQVIDNGDGTLSGDVIDNGDGTYSGDVIDNGDGTYSIQAVERDIEVTASPIFTGWQVMGVTGYPISLDPVNNDNGWNAGQINVGLWVAGQLENRWSAGPVWIQES